MISPIAVAIAHILQYIALPIPLWGHVVVPLVCILHRTSMALQFRVFRLLHRAFEACASSLQRPISIEASRSQVSRSEISVFSAYTIIWLLTYCDYIAARAAGNCGPSWSTQPS